MTDIETARRELAEIRAQGAYLRGRCTSFMARYLSTASKLTPYTELFKP